MKTYKIATIPADGIGPEVISAGVEVLQTLTEAMGSFGLDFSHFDWSSETYKATGKYIPDGGLDELKKHDAILFGAVGAPGTFSFSLHPCPFLPRLSFFLSLFSFPATDVRVECLCARMRLRPRYGFPGVTLPILDPSDISTEAD